MGDESQLLRELEELEVENVESQLNNSQLKLRLEKQKLDESIEIQELERQLEELSMGSVSTKEYQQEEVKERKRAQILQ